MCHRTIYSFVTKSRRDTPDILSMLWVCQYAPDLSAYVPMYVQSERLSKAWITGSALVRKIDALPLIFNIFIAMICMQAYNADSAWWNFCVAGNYVSQFYSFAIAAIRDKQHELQSEFNRDVVEIEGVIRAMLDGTKDSPIEGNLLRYLLFKSFLDMHAMAFLYMRCCRWDACRGGRHSPPY